MWSCNKICHLSSSPAEYSRQTKIPKYEFVKSSTVYAANHLTFVANYDFFWINFLLNVNIRLFLLPNSLDKFSTVLLKSACAHYTGRLLSHLHSLYIALYIYIYTHIYNMYVNRKQLWANTRTHSPNSLLKHSRGVSKGRSNSAFIYIPQNKPHRNNQPQNTIP